MYNIGMPIQIHPNPYKIHQKSSVIISDIRLPRISHAEASSRGSPHRSAWFGAVSTSRIRSDNDGRHLGSMDKKHVIQ